MTRIRRLERKPLSFSTTMRNPMRIANFIDAIIPFEGQILDNTVIHQIVKDVLKRKIYYTMPEQSNIEFRTVLNSSELEFTDAQLEKIIEISPQQHKEAGFDRGWPSRFDTWYKLPKEFGFVYYEIGKSIEISEAGKMLAATIGDDGEAVDQRVSSIFVNALAKYQTGNPFRRNLISNAPFILFLKTIRCLEEEYHWPKTGIYRWEIPFVTCWPNADASELASYINTFRNRNKRAVGNEIVYSLCLDLLESKNQDRFKIDQITKEGVDDFIRKLRITGLVSLRGMGRLIDINKFEKARVDYLISNYANFSSFQDEYDYYKYAGSLDHNLISIPPIDIGRDKSDIRKCALYKWSNETRKSIIDEELKVLGARNGKSKHEFLKFIDEPTRLEFLVSVALQQQFPDADVSPNYSVDDEGMPTFTARGGLGDIEVYGLLDDVLVEVTLMQSKNQAVNEIPGITRHLKEFKDRSEKNAYSLFIAPSLHPDTEYMIGFTKYQEKLEINGYTIANFIHSLRSSMVIGDMRIVEL